MGYTIYTPTTSMREFSKTMSLLNGETKSAGESYRLPKRAKLVRKDHGIDINGNVVTVVVLQSRSNRRRGSNLEQFYVVQFREIDREIDRSSRRVRQFSGIDARLRMKAEMVHVGNVLERSRITAAERYI